MRIKDILNEDENPCWKGYEMIGTKKKNGKDVPNCVPKNEIWEAKDMGDLFYDYLNDKASIDDLQKSNSKIKLTKKGVDDVLRNKSMLDILSSIHDIPVNKIKNKLQKLSKSNVLEYADALEKTKEVDPEHLDEANLASTLKSDVAKELKVSPNSLSVGEAFTPKKTKDGNRIVVIGLDTKVKNVSIPQADYFGKEITNGGYLIVKANASSGKLMKVIGRVKDRRDIKLSDYVNEAISSSFTKAAEKYQDEQLKLQDIVDKQEDVVKKFKKASGKEKERLKKDIVKLHRDQKEQMKKVHDAEARFEKALNNEPVELEESSRLTDILDEIKPVEESAGCGCSCDGKKKVNEKYNVNLKTGKYDIGASQHATGTFFYNRKEEENGDYKNIAKVQNGKVTFLDKNLPNKVKTHIEKYVKQNESLSEDVTVVDRQHNIVKVTDERGDDWYVKKIDSTHMYMANDPKYLKKDRPLGAMTHHIGQHRDAPYYSDLRSWLKESVNEAKLDKKDIVFKEKAPSGYFRVVAKRNSSGRGKQDKFSMYIIDKSGDIKQGWGTHSSLSGAKKFISDKDYDPKKSGDGIFDGINENIDVYDERVYNKGKGIIIMLDKNGKKTSAIFKNKKNADKYNRNKQSDLEKLYKIAKKTPYPKAIDESMNEAVKPSKTIEKFQKVVDDSQRQRIGGTMVDLTTANMVMQVYNQTNDRMKEKLNKLSSKKLIDLVFKLVK